MKHWICVCLALALTACDGDNSESSDNSFSQYDRLILPAPEKNSLRPANAEELEQLLKNGVRIGVRERHRPTLAVDSARTAAVDMENSAPSYSETNVQVAGVDESDYVKYDGQYMYLHAFPRGGDDTDNRIRIVRSLPESATAEPVSEISMGSEANDIQLYLQDVNERASSLVALKSAGFQAFWDWSLAAPYQPDPVTTEVQLFDLIDIAAPREAWRFKVDGRLHASRKIGDMLYLVTSYSPFNNDLASQESAVSTDAQLSELSLQALLPSYQVNNGERMPLHGAGDCLIGQDAVESEYGYANLHYVLALNLATQALESTLCLSSPVDDLYSSQQNLYLSAAQWADNWEDSYTVLHKIALTDSGVQYRATGHVRGTLGGATSSAFRMDEYQDRLRVVTSIYQDGEDSVDNRLWVLAENSDAKTLNVVAVLPNSEYPDAIGKANEDIYAVRFFGDKAYIVTFRQTDPLYVLDLSDIEDIHIAGALEIPGFSTYLHAIGENYLFGFGRDATEEGRQLGMQAALYDVFDESNPTLLGGVKIGSTYDWSDALYDHKALTFLPVSDDEIRIAIPAMINDSVGITTFNGTEDTSEELIIEPVLVSNQRVLVLLAITGLASNNPELTLEGTLTLPASNAVDGWQNYSVFGRGILHNDTVYFVNEPDIWSAFWSMPQQLLGPF